MLSTAATVTAVTGASAAQVLESFGADPAEPVDVRDLLEDHGIDPWVAVLPVDGGVLAVRGPRDRARRSRPHRDRGVADEILPQLPEPYAEERLADGSRR